ncbi:polysaccharide biosynthesis C-terminal domain-containing protein [Vagococcus sp. CY52-2]|uniref:oligosaccharide flippase family protein n=1 Tax=Vagococcus sp. CY52-2 TaxID=2925838 RepID=UPI001F57FEF1|nr:polysaccharide biosynthesis C-terminal domain-containing protein [Vagococcus sp. CY52-2]UNM89970.1 polysaccharide biosynthesis C-terminal domain-containing protein [Vagococcus sp. CY52-2]
MKKKLIHNIIYQGLYQLTLIILPIITIPIVSHALGAEGLGIYNYVSSIVSYFILFAGLGLANYGIREIAIVKDNKYKLSMKFWELEIFNIEIISIILLLYFIFLLFVGNKLFFLISSFSLLATLFDISWFYYGIEDFKSISIINFIIKILSFICILLFVKDINDLWLYFGIQSMSVFLSNLSLWIFMRNKILWIKPDLKRINRHFKPASRYFIGKISLTLYTNMNKTLLGLMVSSVAVGLYSNSLQLITIFVTLIGTLDTVLMPHMTKLFSDNNHSKMIDTMEKSLDLQFFLSIPLMFGIVLVNNKMIPWFFGSDFELLNVTVPILAPLVVIMPLGISIVRQYLIPKNKIKEFNISVIVAAIISILLNVILLPIIGMYGAIIATFVSECLVTIIRLYDLKKNTTFRFSFKKILIYITSSIVMYIVVYVITKDMNANIITTIIQGVFGMIIYFIVTMLFKENVFMKFMRTERK